MHRLRRPLSTAIACLLLPVSATAFEGYYSHPTVSGDQLAFQSEGDLWVAPLAGGTAERLTTHIEIETQPVFSRDGTHIAFIAGYDGGREVYVMPATGGQPRRITFEDSPATVEGWTAAGEVLISTTAIAGPWGAGAIRAINPDTLAKRDWPLMGANEAAVSEEGTHYFTRFGQRFDHSKQYQGGTMAQLWRFDENDAEATRLLADMNANTQRPLWVAGRLFFLSDKSGNWNLWSVDAEGGDLQQHTQHETYAARNADSDGATIVYQHGADIRRFNPSNGSSTVVPLEIRSDFDHTRKRYVEKPADYVESVTLAPNGDYLAIAARGQLTLAGLPTTRRIHIPTPPELRVREAQISPDGDFVYALVADGEHDEIVRYSLDGSGDTKAMTRDSDSRRGRMVLSPDGAWLVHNDFRGRLNLTATQSGATTVIQQSPGGDDAHVEMVFSPDSGLLAFTNAGGIREALYLHDLNSGKTERIASERFGAFSPAFSQDGKWLYFVSDRHYDANPGSPWGDRNMGPAFDARDQILALDLTGDSRFPFLHPALGMPVDESSDESDDDDPVSVAWEGLASRLYQVPVKPGNYSELHATEDLLFVLNEPWGGDPELVTITIDHKPKTETFAKKVDGYDLTADSETLYFSVDKKPYITPVSAKAPKDLADATVAIGNWRIAISPQEEWQQMFHDAWRMHRDFSFDPNMRGLDWEAVRDQYAPLVKRITHREELEDLLGEMIAELDILHSAVRGAELPKDKESAKAATLAAEYKPTESGLEITRIYSGDPDLLEERSPLARPEVGAQVGDVITHVNQRTVRSPADLTAALAEQAKQPTLLTLKRGRSKAREVTVLPLEANKLRNLRYRDWERRTRATVQNSSEGRIGYLHLNAMTSRDINDFAREYFAQYDKQGLVIDVRGNGGGNIDSWIIGKLAETAWAFWENPYGDESYGNHNMQQSFRGHLVVLIDAQTYSDGETFAAGIKALDIAPLIGTRTAGAGIWLSGRNRLVDGGIAGIAEFGQFDIDGNWIVEGYGVAPDIEVDNLPKATWEGGDAQLNRALEYLEQKIAAEPVPVLRGEPIPPVGTPAKDVRRGRSS